jgi:transposase
MTQSHAELDELKVVSVRGDGRRHFDEQSKRKLIEACLQPGVSVACLALKYGVNANLLRKWIRKHPRQPGSGVERALSAFVPVVAPDGADPLAEQRRPLPTRSERARSLPGQRAGSRLSAQLPNGILLSLDCAGQDARLVSAMIETLGRCHVPSGR